MQDLLHFCFSCLFFLSTLSGTCCQPEAPESNENGLTDACARSPCLHDCICVNSCKHSGGYYCESPSGYLGKNCNIAPPQLNCSANLITVSVVADFLEELYSEPIEACLYLGDTELSNTSEICRVCAPVNGRYVLPLFLPFTQCGTTTDVSNGLFSFENVIWAGLKNATTYDIPVRVLGFECLYDLNYQVVTSLTPMMETNRLAFNGSVKLDAFMDLCKISNACPGSCPPLYSVQAGALYTVGETIHVLLSVQSSHLTWRNNNKVVMLEQMHLSCSTESSKDLSTSDASLVDGGCETSLLDASVDRMRSTRTVICVSFKVPRLLRCKDSSFFIHALLRIVDEAEQPDCGVTGSNFQPVKRSVEFPETASTKIGPIFLIEGSDGFANPEVFTFDDVISDAKKPVIVPPSQLNFLVIISICMIVFTVLLLSLVSYRHLYMR